MPIQFKFREDAAPEQRAAVLKAVARTTGATARPLFPGESDPELASLYRVDEVERERDLLALLNAAAEIDFAEPDARRKLIR